MVEKEIAQALQMSSNSVLSATDLCVIHSVIENLTSVLTGVSQDIHGACGFSSLLTIGGPHSDMEDQIVMFT